MKNRLALAVALVTLVAFGGGTALGARSNESTEKVRWISEETENVKVLANGDRPDGPVGPPQPGDEFFFTEDVETKDGTAKEASIGTLAAHCLFGAASYWHCEGTVFLEGGQLHFATTFPDPDPEKPFEEDVAFDGGTGKFRDAGGDAHLTRIAAGKTLWEVHLLHLGNQ